MRIFDALSVGLTSILIACSGTAEEETPGPKPAPTATMQDPTTPSKEPSKEPPKTENPSGGPVAGVPTEPAAMNAWLQTKAYKAWAHESKPHPSTGPHGGSVQTYINAELDASLKSAGGEHAKGSAAVKEFYTGGQLSGWAVMVKTEDASANGKGWYWYEVFDTAPSASGAIEGQGNGTCTGCHSRGDDYFRAPYPLQ